MSDHIAKVLKMIRDKKVEYVDLRFTNLHGKWQHTAQHVSTINDDFFKDGVQFDGSSIAGWKAIEQSDMILMPDPESAVMDPFPAQPHLILFCDILDPETGRGYERDPRAITRRAMTWLKEKGLGDTAYFGPEAEFFIFDDVRWSTLPNIISCNIDSQESPHNTSAEYKAGNLGHRPRVKGGYFPVPPVDSCTDIRADMVTTMRKMGLNADKHHHEVAPSQHELGLGFDTLLRIADHMQIYKYVVHMVAHSQGRTATFMPKPVMGDNGSGMHCHQSIWKDGKNLFAGDKYAGLSQMCLYYIGGIIKHAQVLNAFTNPSTNSYKRLVPGFEAPILLSYSSRNRSALCRIPHADGPSGKRVEVRFPDPSANPYLAFTALLMAGLDGIENKIDPGAAADRNLYDLSPEEHMDFPKVAASLREAVNKLEADHDFLTKGDVMSEDMIASYVALKRQEIERLMTTPHPVEFDMYYST